MVATLLLAGFQSSKPNGLSAMQVIRKMEATYAHLKTYADTGVYTEGHERITFQTFFQSPGRMYFEFTSDGVTNYFCAGGKRGVPPPYPDLPPDKDALKPTWMADAFINGRVERNSLELEIAGFTGISRATAYNIPTMLFPDAAGRQFHEMKQAQIVRKEYRGSEVCYVIKGEDQTLWIGTRTFALFRLDEPSDSGVETTVYQPKLNVPIAPGRFTFKPPR